MLNLPNIGNDSHRRHLAVIDTETLFHTEFLGMFIIHLHTKLYTKTVIYIYIYIYIYTHTHKHNLLFIAIKQKDKYSTKLA
jgi:hypothetical protein